MSDIFCFDTQIIIWGIKNEATEGQEENIDKAKSLLKKCQEENIRIIIPSIVLAEAIVPLSSARSVEFTNRISKITRIYPFDTGAAIKFSQIWKKCLHLAKEKDDFNRTKMKADTMILAIALANKADCLYTEDKGLSNIAGDFIQVRKLPPCLIQQEINFENDSKYIE